MMQPCDTESESFIHIDVGTKENFIDVCINFLKSMRDYVREIFGAAPVSRT